MGSAPTRSFSVSRSVMIAKFASNTSNSEHIIMLHNANPKKTLIYLILSTNQSSLVQTLKDKTFM